MNINKDPQINMSSYLVVGICWYLSIFIVFCCYLLIFVDTYRNLFNICWTLLILNDLHLYLSLFIATCWYLYLLTFIDICCFLLIDIDMCWYVLIFIDACWSVLIFSVHWYLLIFIHCLYWYLLKFVDICWYLSILIHIYLLIAVDIPPFFFDIRWSLLILINRIHIVYFCSCLVIFISIIINEYQQRSTNKYELISIHMNKCK